MNNRTLIGVIAAAAFIGGISFITLSGRPVAKMAKQDGADDVAPVSTLTPEPEEAAVSLPADDDDEEREDEADDDDGKAPATAEAPKPPALAPAKSGSYAMADVQAHATKEDCWSAVDGGVYDLTTWVSRHPGGPDRIIKLCGTDGTAAFTRKHGGSSKAKAALILLKIGTLQ